MEKKAGDSAQEGAGLRQAREADESSSETREGLDVHFAVMQTARAMLSKHPLCDHCLGRQFAALLSGTGNKERGRAVKTILGMEAHRLLSTDQDTALSLLRDLAAHGGSSTAKALLSQLGVEVDEPSTCYLCGGTLTDENLDQMARASAGELKSYEFSSILVGSKVPLPIREKEDKIRAEFGVTTGEDIKREINREVGKRISDITGVEAAFHNPDVTVTVDLFTQKHMVESNPLFIGGRYRKLSRNLPQSVWICPRCRGRGCDDCSGTGRKYAESISEMIGLPSVAHFKASDFKFHAAGREDVDVAVLGSGRPFVLELKTPLKRRGDLGELEKKINTEAADRTEVFDLCYSSRKEARALKTRSPTSTKTYLARVVFDSNLDQSKLDELEASFSNVVVEQKTPTRVLGRRSDRTRRKKLYKLSAKRIDDNTAEFTIKAQGGLYIKELITGDNGRTTPSIYQALDSGALKIDLTVLDVDR